MMEIIPQSRFKSCPLSIIDFGPNSHYREDGTCKCDDPVERERMIREWEYTEQDFVDAGVIPGIPNKETAND